MDTSGSRQGPVAVLCEHCNESSFPVKWEEFRKSWKRISFSKRSASLR